MRIFESFCGGKQRKNINGFPKTVTPLVCIAQITDVPVFTLGYTPEDNGGVAIVLETQERHSSVVRTMRSYRLLSEIFSIDGNSLQACWSVFSEKPEPLRTPLINRLAKDLGSSDILTGLVKCIRGEIPDPEAIDFLLGKLEHHNVQLNLEELHTELAAGRLPRSTKLLEILGC